MKMPFAARSLTLLLAALLLAAAPAAALAAEGPSCRYPAGLFNLNLSDELQGPLFGPVKKATLRSGESYWSASFGRDGRPFSREQFVPGVINEVVVYEAGRPVKRIDNPGTDRQAIIAVRYDGAGRAFKLLVPGPGGAVTEAGGGTLTPQGQVAAKTFRYGGTVYEAVYEYGPAGLVTREVAHMTNRGTVTVERAFDKAGRILSRLQVGSSRPDGPPTADGQNKLDYRYDLKGQLIDIYFQTDKSAAGVPFAIQAVYDDHGNWTRLAMARRDPGGQMNIQVFTQEIEYY